MSVMSESNFSSSFCVAASGFSLSTSSGATRLTSSDSVSTNDTRSAQVIARRVHCLPDWIWRRTSSTSIECLT